MVMICIIIINIFTIWIDLVFFVVLLPEVNHRCTSYVRIFFVGYACLLMNLELFYQSIDAIVSWFHLFLCIIYYFVYIYPQWFRISDTYLFGWYFISIYTDIDVFNMCTGIGGLVVLWSISRRECLFFRDCEMIFSLWFIYMFFHMRYLHLWEH